jgi:hypothetical protein
MRLTTTPPRIRSDPKDQPRLCPLGEPAAGSADHEMCVDRVPFRFAVLTVQPGREELLTLGAIHITMVAHRVPTVPEAAGLLSIRVRI